MNSFCYNANDPEYFINYLKFGGKIKFLFNWRLKIFYMQRKEKLIVFEAIDLEIQIYKCTIISSLIKNRKKNCSTKRHPYFKNCNR